jgi:IS30 family transposase
MLKNNLSPATIWRAHGDAMPCSERTFYRLVHDQSLTDICAMDLPFAVRYRARKAHSHASRPNIKPELLKGRTYLDFLALGDNTCASAVEIDCVCGLKGDKRVLLTLFWREFGFQLAVLLEEHTSECVVLALNELEMSLQEDFPAVLLADRGCEFCDALGIEEARYIYTERSDERTRLFYCDAGRSDQKGRCENAHRIIRRVLPKGQASFDNLCAEQIAVLNSHVNSMPRTSLKGRSPMSLAMEHLPQQFFFDYKLDLIPPERIVLKPHLLGIC